MNGTVTYEQVYTILTKYHFIFQNVLKALYLEKSAKCYLTLHHSQQRSCSKELV